MGVKTLGIGGKQRRGASRFCVGEDAVSKPPAERSEAEFAVLAGLLDLLDRHPDVARKILSDLSADMFTIDYGPEVLDAIALSLAQDCPRRGDVLLAMRRWAAAERCDYEPIQQLLIDLCGDNVTAGPSAERLSIEAADEVRNADRRRRQAERCGDLLAAISDPGATSEEIDAGIDRLVAARDAAGNRDRGRLAVNIMDCLDRWKRNETPPRVPTGFSVIDRHFGGGLPVGLTAIAAHPKVGKSCLSGQLMLGALAHDPELTAVWFRGEMTEDQLLCKMLATWSELRHPVVEPITRGKAETRHAAAAAVAADLAQATAGRLSIIPPPITPAKIAAHLRTLKPRLVVIDYLQKVRADDGQAQRSDKRHEQDDTTTRIGSMALEFNAATIVVSQLSKAARAEDGIGTLAKDSNLLDYEANIFASLWKQKDDGLTLFRINANRDGRECDEMLWFDGSAQFFRPAAAEIHEEFANWSEGSR